MMVRVSGFALAVFLLTHLGSSSLMGQANTPALVFKPAIQEIQSETKIQILLPSRLPSSISEGAIKLARGEVRKDGYFISLYFSADGNASYAGGFGGSTLIFGPKDLPNTRRVALSGGRVGMFRPVSCGGSCAPANLWWEQNGVMYQIQISGGGAPEEQKKLLVEVANAMVPVLNK
jgi:hypothetical protein